MNINKNNYEAFFLDYHEGNLSPQQVADLLLFVEQHPELKEEFECFENVTLDDLSNVSFEGKSSLKKEITLDNREEYFIRNVENTLTSAEKNLLDTFIKQHPQFLTELELFKKTKVFADASVVFENKEALKKTVVTTEDLLIASVEGLLTKQEHVFLNQQLSVDAEMQNNYSLYKQTKLVADASIVYENKEELKRKERKIVPLFYYVAAAASIALLIGLFFIFNGNKNNEQNFADKTNGEKIPPIENNNPNAVVKNNQPIENSSIAPNQVATIVKNNKVKIVRKENSNEPPVIVNEQPLNIAENKPENKNEIAPENNPIAKIEEPKTNKVEAPVFAKVENKQPTTNTPTEFLSLKEVVAQKLKEKTLDEESLAVQKQNGRSKRFTGWDFAQIATRGISKVTGRDVEVKPTYNDEGDVTAYALGGGFQVTRGKQ